MCAGGPGSIALADRLKSIASVQMDVCSWVTLQKTAKLKCVAVRSTRVAYAASGAEYIT